MCWWEAREVPEIRTEILSPAVSPISQRKPDYIKSLNPDFRPKPAVQVLSGGKGGGGRGKKKKALQDLPEDSGGVDDAVFIPFQGCKLRF